MQLTGNTMQNKNIFISFVEEAIMNPDYCGYIGGRIEVYRPEDEDKGYHSEEIRFLTNESERFNAFRDKWDMRKITQYDLNICRERVRLDFSK